MRKHPGGLFQLTLVAGAGDALYDCPDDSRNRGGRRSRTCQPGRRRQLRASNWDYAEEYYGDISWNERDDPCKAAYYRYGSNIRAARNLLASNIGLIAKRAQRGKLLAVATALDTRQATAGREDRRHELPEPGAGQRPHRRERHGGARSARPAFRAHRRRSADARATCAWRPAWRCR